jgi:hypothetical protein
MSVQTSLGTVLTESDGSDEEMIRIKFAYSFF